MKKIIFTSRLDGDSSLGAHLICEIAPKLAEKYPKIQINIIGGGTEYPKIAPMAQKINQKLNQELILLLGTQPRPTDFYDENTLFVGVSRAALEAMSCGSPIILLGNEGYLGLLDESKLPAAIKTNFTCRAHPICTADELFSDISHYYSLPETEKARLSCLSREIVAKYFSAEKMARETLTFYRETIRKASCKNSP
jgi:glycosyltransferase involved in cell wall biosynthesis